MLNGVKHLMFVMHVLEQILRYAQDDEPLISNMSLRAIASQSPHLLIDENSYEIASSFLLVMTYFFFLFPVSR